MAFFAAILTGSTLGTAIGRADGVISNTEHAYITVYGPTAICPVLDEFPTKSGVLGIGEGIMDDGFTAHDAVDILNAAVSVYCPSHWPLLQRIGRQARLV